MTQSASQLLHGGEIMDAQPQEQEAQQSGYWVEIIAGSSTQAEFRRMDRDNLVRFRVQRGDETQVLFVRRGDVQSVDDASSSGGGFYIPAGNSVPQHAVTGDRGGILAFPRRIWRRVARFDPTPQLPLLTNFPPFSILS